MEDMRPDSNRMVWPRQYQIGVVEGANSMAYEYLPSQCDVRFDELPRLERFRERLNVWRQWLFEDEHSIWKQIRRMLWNDTVFRTINECRRLAAQRVSPQVGFNGSVAAFIDEGYVATQLLAIRRLTEDNRRRDAIALPRLLGDMKANADLFTRELYVCHDGLPFDPEPARERSLRRLAAEAEQNDGVSCTYLSTTGAEAYDMAILMHEHFDRLIGSKGKLWCRDDKLGPVIFDRIKSKLGICDGINKVASKFIAHAADAGSRGRLSERDRKITLNRIEACHRVICRVTAYIYGPLLYIGESPLISTPPFGHLENFDKPWLDQGNVSTIQSYWHRRAEQVEQWTQGGWEKLLK